MNNDSAAKLTMGNVSNRTVRLAEEALIARENKRVRTERALNAVWVLGVLSGCAWEGMSRIHGNWLAGIPFIFLWALAGNIYLGFWYPAAIFPKNYNIIKEIFTPSPDVKRIIKGIILVASPWLTRLVILIIRDIL